MNSYIHGLGAKAKAARKTLALLDTAQKNAALEQIAKSLLEPQNRELIKAENAKDLELAQTAGKSAAYIDRLTLNDSRIDAIVEGVRQVAALPDPVGVILKKYSNADGLKLTKKRVPLGTIGIIFESRPNVTVDAAVLCFKSGNTCILRGGSDSINSNKALANIMREALGGQLQDAVCLVEDTSREVAAQMMKMREYLDVLIPRGGEGLKQIVLENSTIPVIFAGGGICHVYVDGSADLDMAVSIVDNAKTQRPSVCNAIETVLVHESVAEEFRAKLEKHWSGKVEIIEGEYETEFLELKLSWKTVKSIDEAIEHINTYGTTHSECIVTKCSENAAKFQSQVDAAAVYVNASTRFTDGFVFGLGAEIGITTQKLHARGPMGLEELTTYKYLINGEGQIRG
ncbi:MAG: glutamate-5-semialdehyde dehydrogenase [Oscillospiraceae bacterium]|nr:glutamate-5-semialdehyde dehydrogenase [Oscillospiraceae bacterium]